MRCACISALLSVFCVISTDAQFLSFSSFSSHMGGDGRMHQEEHTVDHSMLQGADGRLHEQVHEMQSATSQSGPLVQREKSEIICIDGRCTETERGSTQIGAMPAPMSEMSSPALGVLLSEMRPENPLEQQIKHIQEAMSEMRPENPLEQQFQHIQEAMPEPRQSGLRGVNLAYAAYAASSWLTQAPQIQKTLQRPQDITLARVQPVSKAFAYFEKNVLITAIGGLIIGTLVALIMLKVCEPSEAREFPVELKEPLFTAEETETSESEEEEPSAVPLTQLADFLGQDDEQEDDEQEVSLSDLSFKLKPSVGTWYCEKLPK